MERRYSIQLTTQQSVVFRKIVFDTKTRIITLAIRAMDKLIEIHNADFGMYAMIMYGVRISRTEDFALRVMKLTTYTVEENVG